MEPAPAPSLPPQLLRLKQAPANPLGRVSAKIHTTHHSGATVKVCLIGLINKTAFLLQTLGEEGRDSAGWGSVHWSHVLDEENSGRWGSSRIWCASRLLFPRISISHLTLVLVQTLWLLIIETHDYVQDVTLDEAWSAYRDGHALIIAHTRLLCRGHVDHVRWGLQSHTRGSELATFWAMFRSSRESTSNRNSVSRNPEGTQTDKLALAATRTREFYRGLSWREKKWIRWTQAV